ncbi:hypothetical protein Nepgr_023062 [Nepenthes gracilis]|uniref:Uncharacterized protein n=1 Tax=Nepenthes gracilis TaxID=150966 RepID=A0AAD3T1S2_NEPGR|nr:hypothetical protein Nepgr_023062 [Nepenthes gracilis]
MTPSSKVSNASSSNSIHYVNSHKTNDETFDQQGVQGQQNPPPQKSGQGSQYAFFTSAKNSRQDPTAGQHSSEWPVRQTGIERAFTQSMLQITGQDPDCKDANSGKFCELPQTKAAEMPIPGTAALHPPFPTSSGNKQAAGWSFKATTHTPPRNLPANSTELEQPN